MFLPVFSFLSLAKNVPNPLKKTDSSCFIDSLISNIKDSTTTDAVVFSTPVLSDILLIISAFVIFH